MPLYPSQYPPVIKHGNGKYTIYVIFLLKPPFIRNSPMPRLITRGYPHSSWFCIHYLLSCSVIEVIFCSLTARKVLPQVMCCLGWYCMISNVNIHMWHYIHLYNSMCMYIYIYIYVHIHEGVDWHVETPSCILRIRRSFATSKSPNLENPVRPPETRNTIMIPYFHVHLR